MTLLSVRGLSIAYDTPGGEPVSAVRNVSFDIAAGEFVGLVGESGSGKSTLGYAIARLLKAPGRIAGGEVLLDGVDLAGLTAAEVRRQRRGGVAMVLQSGMNALNPVRTIEKHFLDIFEAHGHVAADQRGERMRELLRKVELSPDVLHRYSGELSGGMRQRVSIALALSLDPRLVVFDEPTTALDVLVQKAVMETITSLQASEGFTAILISHDLGVVLEATDRVLVMHDGRIVEDASSEGIATSPSDDYTRMLLSHYDDPRAKKLHVPGFESERPRTEVSARPGRSARETIVVDGVGKVYRRARGEQPVVAVDDVSFTLEPGASLALVGASGSGKSTLARLVTGIESPTSGSVSFGGRAVDRLRGRRLKSLHHEIQLVFQDPYAALNPMHTVGYTLSRPVINFSDRRGAAVRSRVYELLETVGLTPVEQFAAKLPHQLSGGQRQRVVIARALACDPQVIVADEPVSMLDVSLRAGVLSLLRGLGDQWGVSMLYITHDLLSARLVTDEILVLNQGRVVERGNTVSVLQHPTDPYTVRLLDAIPVPTSRGPKS